MNWLRIARSELRKLTTTRLLLWYSVVLAAYGVIVAFTVIVGSENQGAAGFIDTLEDQQSLFAFGANALMITGLFGAAAVGREYTHATVVPTYLVTPRRRLAMSAQLVAVVLAGCLLGLIGEAVTLAAGAASLPVVGYSMLLPGSVVAQLLAASILAGAVGALVGAGTAIVVRNTGGAVAAAVGILIIAPPIAAQLLTSAGSWIPSSLIATVSGLGSDIALASALIALAAWGLIPAAIGIGSGVRRDVI